MKYIPFLVCACLLHCQAFAQKVDKQYPEGEFSNEIYLLRKDTALLVRLEKNHAEMETKTKFAGMGAEMGYSIEKEKSNLRFTSGHLTFIYYIAVETGSNKLRDSILSANGIDPGSIDGSFGMDPSRAISLYSLVAEKGERKAITYSGGASPLGKSKKQSTKYSVSIKKIRAGYYEIIPDKALPKGEYAFVLMTDPNNMTGSHTIFAFGVD